MMKYFFQKSYLWPKGDFSILLDHSYIPFGPSPVDTFKLALQFISYHGYFNGTQYITFRDWYRIALQKMLLTDDVAISFFISAKHIEEVNENKETYTIISKDNLLDDLTNNDKVDKTPNIKIIYLSLVIVMSGYRQGPLNDYSREEINKISSFRIVYHFIKRNIKRFLSVLLLCHPKLMVQMIKDSNKPIEVIESSAKIHIEYLINLNIVFEGTVVSIVGTINERSIIPDKCWGILSKKIVTTFGVNEIRFDEICGLMDILLQQDMFGVHDCLLEPIKIDGRLTNGHKKFTPSCLSKYRKLVINSWTHIEVLTSPLYQGVNLRLSNGSSKSSYLFFPHYTKSIIISDTKNCKPIILGPVKDVIFINNVHNTSISVMTHRLIIRNSTNLTLFLSINTPPIISIDCKNIKLAPYNVFYTDLERQLNESNIKMLPINENQWNKPIILEEIFPQTIYKTIIISNHLNDEEKIYNIMKPNDFYIQPTIFDMNFKSKFFTFFRSSTIPKNYMKSWEDSLSNVYKIGKDKFDDRNNLLTNKDINYLMKKCCY
uniref:C-CAP/cofactor C-like domain-containing protein n=1 Tax=Parastrongyloides trichosuri TaxID=131310 RepID=A0A0N4Z6F7_PARTI